MDVEPDLTAADGHGFAAPPVMTHPDRWRLDQLLGWEDRRIAAAEAAAIEAAVAAMTLEPLTARLPQPQRTRRRSASARHRLISSMLTRSNSSSGPSSPTKITMFVPSALALGTMIAS